LSWGKSKAGMIDIQTANILPVETLNDVKYIASREGSSLIIKNDGTVWAWGNNDKSKIGGNEPYIDTPTMISGFNDVVSVDIEGFNSAIVKSDGSLWMCGLNQFGQLLNDSITDKAETYVKIDQIDNVEKVELGFGFVVVLKKDGTIWSWGRNFEGQLCDGTVTPRSTPTKIKGTDTIIDIAVGKDHSYLLKSDGTVWKWRKDWTSRDKDILNYSQIIDTGDIRKISAGENHLLALKADGTVISLEENDRIHLGNAVGEKYKQATIVEGINNVGDVFAGESYSLVLKNDGSVWGWGTNENGELGDGILYSVKYIPQQVVDKENNKNGVIKIRVDSPNMIFNGVIAEIDPGRDTTPKIITGSTMIPIRNLIESIGGKAEWDETNQKAIIENSTNKIEMWIDSQKAIINGKEEKLHVSPIVVNGRTMVPLRFIMEKLGLNVSWDELKQEVTILY